MRHGNGIGVEHRFKYYGNMKNVLTKYQVMVQ